MSNSVYSDILIVNTRTNGQDPNVLYAEDEQGILVPKLSVHKKTTPVPANALWNIVYDNPGGQFRLEINDKYDNTYCLGVEHAPSNGMNCVLVKYGQAGFCTAWAFPFATRLLSAAGSGFHDYAGTSGTFSLDAGNYPKPIVFKFNSGVNQTWQYGSSIDHLQPMPN